MANHYKVWALALISFLLASPAMADEDEGSAYVFLNAGAGVVHNGCKSYHVSGLATIGGATTCTERNPAYRAGVGYQFTPMWGLEASYGIWGYASSGGTANFASTGITNYSWDLRARGLEVLATTTLHMGDVFSVFAKFGVARIEYDEYLYGWNTSVPPGYLGYYYYPVVNDTRITPAVAGGVRFDVTAHGSVLLMAEAFNSHDIFRVYGLSTKVRVMSGFLGLMYRY